MRFSVFILVFLFTLACSHSGTTGSSDSTADTSNTRSSPDSGNPDSKTGDAGKSEFTPLAPPPEGEGFQMSMAATAPAGEEIWICDVYTMPNKDAAAINLVEVQQTPGTHHLTLSTLGLLPGTTVPHGRYDCAQLYGDSSLMEDQIMFYGNQGSAEHKMQLPKGVAATIPAGLDVIYEMHYVNVTGKPVEVYSRLNAWTMPIEDVKKGIWGGTVRDENINIPAGAKHTEWSRCVMNEDVEIVFLASHTHSMGIEFTIAPYDGKEVGEVFYKNTDWHTPQIKQYEPVRIVPKGQGFEWTCTWNNTTDKVLNYGLNATDEMCNMAVVFTPFSTTAQCEVVETSDGVLWQP